MKIKPQTTVFISIFLVLAGILGSWALGWWQTESEKVPQRLESLSETEVAGAYDPADIRGSYTFEEISRFYGVPLEDLADAFTVERDRAAGFKVKDFETLFPDPESEVGTSSMKLFVAWYKGLPYELSEDSFLPAPAAAILREKAELSEEQLAYLDAHTLEGVE
jgi:hypothetical protein